MSNRLGGKLGLDRLIRMLADYWDYWIGFQMWMRQTDSDTGSHGRRRYRSGRLVRSTLLQETSPRWAASTGASRCLPLLLSPSQQYFAHQAWVRCRVRRDAALKGGQCAQSDSRRAARGWRWLGAVRGATCGSSHADRTASRTIRAGSRRRDAGGAWDLCADVVFGRKVQGHPEQ
jgi:hypothetical protein